MPYQLEDDPIKYHQEAIRHYEREIREFRSEGLKHYHAESRERLQNVTGEMLEVVMASKKMHEGHLVLERSYLTAGRV